jgi:hypothetical protein
MIVNIKTVDTQEKTKPFNIAAFAFSYTEAFDKTLLDTFIDLATKQAKSVNSGTANSGSTFRPLDIKITDSFTGLLAEYAWKYFINLTAIDIIVAETEMVSAKSQIDLKVLHNKKTIEIRSSIVRNGVKFALTNPNSQFHLVGPYENEYKPHEGQKSYYLGALFQYAGEKRDFVSYVKDSNNENKFVVWIIAGATREMMLVNGVDKGFSAGDVNTGSSKYKAMKFTDALDAVEIASLIINDN